MVAQFFDRERLFLGDGERDGRVGLHDVAAAIARDDRQRRAGVAVHLDINVAAEPDLFERFSHVLVARQSGLSEIASTANQKLSLQKDIVTQMRQFFSRMAGGRK